MRRNCYVLREDEGTILIDPGPPGGGERVIAKLTGSGIRPETIRLIFITHGHLDHYGAAEEVNAWCGAPVAAFRAEPDFSRDRRNALPPAQTVRGSLIRGLYLLMAPLMPFKPLQADVLLDDHASLAPYGVNARVVPVPGHSPGSLAVVGPQGELFAGDLFVNYTVPSQPIYVSDRKAWQRSYESIRALNPRMVYVGHGEPFSGDKLSHIYPARYQLRWWVR